MLVAPRAPAGCVLGETEVMNEVQRARPWTKTRLELVLVGRKVRPEIVKLRDHAGFEKCLHFGAVVVARHERFVAGTQAERSYALAEPVPRPRVELERIDREREWKRRAGPAHVDVDRQRRPQLELCCCQVRRFQIRRSRIRLSIASHEPAAV